MKELLKKEEKKVEYLELIYDLIFVYIIGRNNSLLHHTAEGRIQGGMFLAYVLCTLAVIQIWSYSAYFINMFGKNGLREHIFLFANMFLLYFIGEGTREHWQSYHTQYHAAWGLILLNIALQYAIEYHKSKDSEEKRRGILRIMLVIIIEAVLVFASIPVFIATGIDFSVIPILFGIVMTMLNGRKSNTVFIDFAHLSERIMLYVVFTFGEMVIAVAGYFEGEFNLNSIFFSLLGFLIVVGLFLSYGTFYDHIIDREQQNDGLWYMLIHIFIIFGLNNITTSLEFMREEEIDLLPKTVFLIGSFLMYYVFLFLTRRYAKRSCRPPISFYLKMAGLAASFIVLMLLLRDQMQLNIALSVIYIFVVYSIIYRIGRWNKE